MTLAAALAAMQMAASAAQTIRCCFTTRTPEPRIAIPEYDPDCDPRVRSPGTTPECDLRLRSPRAISEYDRQKRSLTTLSAVAPRLRLQSTAPTHAAEWIYAPARSASAGARRAAGVQF
ncbi:MAG: hypothetical protein AMXMBFR47_04040 [Planctomycetota bacterium]